MNIKGLFFLIFLGLYAYKADAQKSINIVPYPKEVKLQDGYFTLQDGFTIGSSANDLSPIADLLINDMHILYKFSASYSKGKAELLLQYDSSLAKEEYTIRVNDKKIIIKGGSYNAVCMGATSLLQMAEPDGQKLIFPKCYIKDKPTSDYRGVMVDVARQWINIVTLKQVVELCRWYKIRYLQLHLSDDQSFTFPSLAYPQLATKDRHYTVEELESLVAFAKKRGVVIIPEFDAPGHTTAIRNNMSQLFGTPNLGVIDMNNERVYGAMDTIMKEMMDIFYTSPYFHIGGDEAWLGNYEKLPQTREYIKKMGFDNAHDVYLNFLVRMYNIVKKYHKKPLMWESFQGTGSNKVHIPKDMIVFAWETAYQRPDSLVKHGYTIINASWKPTYVTPGWRWEPEYIYHWNIRRWENHWSGAPSYHQPIQLGESAPVMGGQLCTWEMNEGKEIPSLHQRVPAISEVLWNGDKKRSYSDFRKRYKVTDYKYNRLIFPVKVEKEGFTFPNYEGIFYNKENNFGDGATIKFTPLLPGTKITYTTNGKMPMVHSSELPSTLHIDKNYKARLGVFDNKGNRIGYKIVSYELNAIIPKIKGHTIALRDTDITRPEVDFISNVMLSFQDLKPGSEIRFTTDGSRPSINSRLYSEPIQINSSSMIKATCFYNGAMYGKSYESEFVKEDYEKCATTGKRIYTENGKMGENIDKAVDGFVNKDNYWDSHGQASSVIVDLGKITNLRNFTLFTYWDGNRIYTYKVELSKDGKEWTQVIDRSNNKMVANKEGYKDSFPAQGARYIKIQMLSNSSMPIVEIRAN